VTTAPTADLATRRLLIVGASSGIGAATARAAIHAGAAVVLAARRVERLEALVSSAASATARGHGIAVPCDVRSPDSIAAAIDRAVDELSGLDTVLYATGITHLAPLAETRTDDWRALFETNVVGAALVTAAALPALRRASERGRVGYLSSHSVPQPWPGLVAYAATKAALETMIQGWRTEAPDVVFTRIVIGPTMTPMADGWDPTRAREHFERWNREERLAGFEPVAPEAVAAAILGWLADPNPADDVAMPNAMPNAMHVSADPGSTHEG